MASAQVETQVRTWTPKFFNKEGDTEGDAEVNDVEFVASYCWFNPDREKGTPVNPTVVIPGKTKLLNYNTTQHRKNS